MPQKITKARELSYTAVQVKINDKSNGNRIWSIWSAIIRVITKSDDRARV